MDINEAWAYEHAIECPVTADFAWRFWSEVSNWRMDADVEAVELEGPFAAGARGATITRSQGRAEWRLASVGPGRCAVVEIPVEGAAAQFQWSFEDSGNGTRMVQRVSLAGEGAAKLIAVLAPMVEENTPAGMVKLCEAMVKAAGLDKG